MSDFIILIFKKISYIILKFLLTFFIFQASNSFQGVFPNFGTLQHLNHSFRISIDVTVLQQSCFFMKGKLFTQVEQDEDGNISASLFQQAQRFIKSINISLLYCIADLSISLTVNITEMLNVKISKSLCCGMSLTGIFAVVDYHNVKTSFKLWIFRALSTKRMEETCSFKMELQIDRIYC